MVYDWLNMFTIKSKRPTILGVFSSKMEKAKQLEHKREISRKRRAGTRKDMLMIAYVNKRFPLVYKEAEMYFKKLNAANPTKLDLRKTNEFRQLDQMPSEMAKDKMILQIPITSKTKQTLPGPLQEPNEMALQSSIQEPHELPNQTCLEQVLPDDLQNIQPLFDDNLLQKQMEKIMDELRNDPDINNLMNEVEIETSIFDEIDDDDRLEDELKYL